MAGVLRVDHTAPQRHNPSNCSWYPQQIWSYCTILSHVLLVNDCLPMPPQEPLILCHSAPDGILHTVGEVTPCECPTAPSAPSICPCDHVYDHNTRAHAYMHHAWVGWVRAHKQGQAVC
jgi:hypothetical protein